MNALTCDVFCYLFSSHWSSQSAHWLQIPSFPHCIQSWAQSLSPVVMVLTTIAIVLNKVSLTGLICIRTIFLYHDPEIHIWVYIKNNPNWEFKWISVHSCLMQHYLLLTKIWKYSVVPWWKNGQTKYGMYIQWNSLQPQTEKNSNTCYNMDEPWR